MTEPGAPLQPAESRDPSNPDDAERALLSLVELYLLDTPDPRDVLNRVAWTLRENGWGLWGDSHRHLVNAITGAAYLVSARAAGISLIPVQDFPISEFVDPVEPAPTPSQDLVAAIMPDHPSPTAGPPEPDTPLGFLKASPEDRPLTVEDLDRKLNHVIGLFETALEILDKFDARLGQSYVGETRIMGRKVRMTLTPVDPDSTVAP